MRLTLYRYIFREICSIFLVSLLVFIFVMMASKMLWVADLLINQHVKTGHVLQIIFYLLPRIIIFSLPAACLMCVLLTFLRLSNDNEVIALHSSGISLYQTLPPVICFSLISYLLASVIAIYGVPWGNRSYRDVVLQVVESKADVAIKERIFYEPFDDVVFYVNSFSARDKTLKDLFVVDRRGIPITNTIVAKRGMILSNPRSRMVTIHFIDGTIFTVEKGFKTVRTIKFDTYDLNVDLEDIVSAIAAREKRPEGMFIKELIYNLKRAQGDRVKYNQLNIRLFEMFSIPLAIFLMGMIGVPLGAHVRVRGRTKGIVISLVLFLVYYICLVMIRYACETGALPPSLGVWIPDVFLLITCIYLLHRVANDRPVFALMGKWLKPQSRIQFPRPADSQVKAERSHTIGGYIGSVSGHKFHKHDCRWVGKISSGNRVSFGSTQEALDRGYMPCHVCKPT